MRRDTFTILPHGTLYSDGDDYTQRVEMLEDGKTAVTTSPDLMNVSLSKYDNALSKTEGYIKYTNSTTTGTNCLWLREYDNGNNTVYLVADGGRVYHIDASLDPIDITPSGVTFASDNSDYFSDAPYGTAIVFTDKGENTPYKYTFGDSVAEKVITTGTEMSFRYILEYYNYLLGFYRTDGTPQPRSINWSSQAGNEFPAGQEITSLGADPITGCFKMLNFAYVTSYEAADRIDFYAQAQDNTSLFGVVPILNKLGTSSHNSIVNMTGEVGEPMVVWFNKSAGFVSFDGRSAKPISNWLRTKLRSIGDTYTNRIVGTLYRPLNEVIWTVPLNGALNNTHLIRWNYLKDVWTVEDLEAYYITVFSKIDKTIWRSIDDERIWNDYATLTYAQVTGVDRARMVFGKNDGQIYYQIGDGRDGTAITCYREEPALDFGKSEWVKRILEIRFFFRQIDASTTFNVYVRTGDSPYDLFDKEYTSYTATGSVNMMRVYVDHSGRFIQIKYGTGGTDDFALDKIEIDWVPLSRI